MRGGGYGSNIIGFVIVIVVLYLLYALYNWLYSKNANTSTTQIGGYNMPMGTVMKDNQNVYLKKTTDGQTYVASQVLKGFTNAGQYSTSMWVYVIDSKSSTASQSKLCNLLEINSGETTRFSTPKNKRGTTLLYIGLNPKNAALVIRQSTMDGENSIDNTLDQADATRPSTKYPLSTLISSYNSGSTYTGNDRCDIVNGIEYQRWVLVSTVANGRTLDVYIDGKLARSCVYKAGYLGGNGTATGYLGLDNDDKLKGYFSFVNYYQYALSPEEVWGTYQAGPSGPFSLSNWLSSYFSLTLTLNGNKMNDLNPYESCPK
jgi:Concanavalin A-like lectin/glucanases superfamily